jgi:hypothetical protein
MRCKIFYKTQKQLLSSHLCRKTWDVIATSYQDLEGITVIRVKIKNILKIHFYQQPILFHICSLEIDSIIMQLQYFTSEYQEKKCSLLENRTIRCM